LNIAAVVAVAAVVAAVAAAVVVVAAAAVCTVGYSKTLWAAVAVVHSNWSVVEEGGEMMGVEVMRS